LGRSVIKPDPKDDFYVVYSSIVDLPVFWGTRKQMLKNTKKNWNEDEWWPKVKDLDQADRWPYPGNEDIEEVIWAGRGTFSVDKLKDMCALLDLGLQPDDPRILLLLDREGWDD
jgi:hypothetical protein